MSQFLATIFGIPFTAQQRETAFANMVGARSREDAIGFLRETAQHNTEKSGALLGAQGIFVIVDTFALDKSWPQALLVASLLLLLAGALLLMTNLRSTLGMYRKARTPDDAAKGIFKMVVSRMVRFNVALYLTFGAILLLAVAALTFLQPS